MICVTFTSPKELRRNDKISGASQQLFGPRLIL
jgi:hypothetical protein